MAAKRQLIATLKKQPLRVDLEGKMAGDLVGSQAEARDSIAGARPENILILAEPIKVMMEAVSPNQITQQPPESSRQPIGAAPPLRVHIECRADCFPGAHHPQHGTDAAEGKSSVSHAYRRGIATGIVMTVEPRRPDVIPGLLAPVLQLVLEDESIQLQRQGRA